MLYKNFDRRRKLLFDIGLGFQGGGGGGGYPAILDDGNTVAWFDYTRGITSDSEKKVSQWDDWRGEGTVSLTQATDTDKPLELNDGIYFDGDDDNLFSGVFTYGQPATVYIVVNQWLWASYRHIFGGGDAWDGSLMQRTTNPNLTIRSSSETAENATNNLYEYQVIRVHFDGVNSSIQVNEETKTIGNAGSDGLDGITFGAIGGGSVYYGNITIKEAIFRSISDSEEDDKTIFDYLDAKYKAQVYYKYFQVDTPLVGQDKGITRIHDLINDDSRNSIWGITRSEDYLNYVFKMNKTTGDISRSSLMPNGNKNMAMCMWEDDSGNIWSSIIGEAIDKIFLAKTNMSTMVTTLYPHSLQVDCAGLSYNNGYIYIGDITRGYVMKFDVENETYIEVDITNVTELYWGAHDGANAWFNGKMSSGNECLVKVESDLSFTVYDLGVAHLGGGELTFDGRYLWQGSNNSNNMVRFDTTDNSIDVITMGQFPRLNAVNGSSLFCMNNNGPTLTALQRIDMDTLVVDTGLILLPEITYSHGLCIDANYAWIGSWQDDCYIYRVPIDYNSPLS